LKRKLQEIERKSVEEMNYCGRMLWMRGELRESIHSLNEGNQIKAIINNVDEEGKGEEGGLIKKKIIAEERNKVRAQPKFPVRRVSEKGKSNIVEGEGCFQER